MTHSSHHEGPYLFDVGVIALAHTDAPVRDAALSYVRRAIAGEIEAVVRGGFGRAGAANVDGWDGYYAEVASAEGVNTVVTLDDDFERFEEFATEIVLSPAEFEELNAYLEG